MAGDRFCSSDFNLIFITDLQLPLHTANLLILTNLYRKILGFGGYNSILQTTNHLYSFKLIRTWPALSPLSSAQHILRLKLELEMNWTGGALSRSRNANGKLSLSVKQKNHFAKARVKLQNGQRTSPPEIQYFDFGEWKPENQVHDDRHSDPVKQRVSSQRTLDQFQNVQGVVRKLKSLRPRNERGKRKRSLINDTEGYVLPSGIPIPPISPAVISSRPPSSSSPIQAEPTEERVVKRIRTSTSPMSDELYPLAALDGVEAKRHRLLQETDWVGIERQKCLSKPAKMKFTDPEDRDLIGRRRPLNSSAIQNRWNVQGSRPMKIPLMAPCNEEGEDWSPDVMSIRIGSTATNKGPISDEMLDCYQTPEPVKRAIYPVRTPEYRSIGHETKSQHRKHEGTTPSSLGKEPSEPFRSLFSPEEVEQSGVAQLVEAATIAEDHSPPLVEGELQLPDDYEFPEPESRFRLVYEHKSQAHGQTSELDHGSGPIVRDFAFIDGRLQRAAVEQPARPEGRNILEDQISEHAPTEDARPSTSPLSIATSRYMQELEEQSYGTGGQNFFPKNVADRAVPTRAQPAAIDREVTEDERETNVHREPKVWVPREEVQDKESIQPTEDEDEVWRTFINLDGVHDSRSSRPTSTHIRPPTARASLQKKQTPDQPPTSSDTHKVPPCPPDDEQIWRDFIFSSPNPNNEWILEEASPEPHVPDTDTSTPDPARTQPSMVAEAATSPVKQNPHLQDEILDGSPPILDNASRYAHASTSSTTESPVTTEHVRSMASRVPYPSDSQPSTLTATSPATHNSRNPQTTSNPSSLIPQAPSSPSIPQSLSPTNTTTHTAHNPSSDELSWTPTRLPNPPPPKKTSAASVIFKKPTRYNGGERKAPSTVHLGRNVGKSKSRNRNDAEGKGEKKVKEKGKEREEKGKGEKKGKEKETKSLAEAVERAKKQMGSRKDRKKETKREGEGEESHESSRDESESESEEMETDEIVD